MRLLQGWNDKTLYEDVEKEELEINALQTIEAKDKILFKECCKRVIKDLVKDVMEKNYQDCEPEIASGLKPHCLTTVLK